MKTKLPSEITTVEQAQEFLTTLHKNKESFNPDDDASELAGYPFTKEEGAKLNALMNQMFALKDFDPNDFVFDLMYDHVLQRGDLYLTHLSKEGYGQWVKNIEHAWRLNRKGLDAFYKDKSLNKYQEYLNAVPK